MRSLSFLIPYVKYQLYRASIQEAYHFSSSSGLTKYSISICSNSRVLNVELPGVISLRKDFPICATPKGSFLRVVSRTFKKLTKIPWAVSGLKYVIPEASSTGPRHVLSIRLNIRGGDVRRSILAL